MLSRIPGCCLAELAYASHKRENKRAERAGSNFLSRSHGWNLFTAQRFFCNCWLFAEFNTKDWCLLHFFTSDSHKTCSTFSANFIVADWNECVLFISRRDCLPDCCFFFLLSVDSLTPSLVGCCPNLRGCQGHCKVGQIRNPPLRRDKKLVRVRVSGDERDLAKLFWVLLLFFGWWGGRQETQSVT